MKLFACRAEVQTKLQTSVISPIFCTVFSQGNTQKESKTPRKTKSVKKKHTRKYSSTLFVMLKKASTIQFVLDFCKTNAMFDRNSLLTPKIKDLL